MRLGTILKLLAKFFLLALAALGCVDSEAKRESLRDGAAMSSVAGDRQSAEPGAQFPTPLAVKIDHRGQPLSGEMVSFEQVSGPPVVLATPQIKTDETGTAAVVVTAGGALGSPVVRAKWQDSSLEFALQIVSDARLTLVAGSPQIARSGLVLTTPLKVKATRGGLPVAGETIQFEELSDSKGRLGRGSVVTDGEGMAQTTYVPFAKSLGLATIEARWKGASVRFLITIEADSTLVRVAGDNQSTDSTSPFSIPLQVRASRQGQPVSGESVLFSVVSGPAVTLSQGVVSFNANGLAETTVTPSAGGTGPLLIRATWGEHTVDFDLEVTDESLHVVGGQTQTADPSQTFGAPLAVRVMRNGVPLAEQKVFFSVVSGAAPIFLTSGISTTDSDGNASVIATAGATLGTTTVRATWKQRSVDFTLIVHLNEQIVVIGGNLQSSAPSLTFPQPLQVQILKNGAAVPGESVRFIVQSGAGVTLATPVTPSNTNGMAQTHVTAQSATGVTLVKVVWRSQTESFTLNTAPQTNAIVHVVSGQNQSGFVGTTLPQPLVIEARDGTTQVPLANINVRFLVSAGNGQMAGNTTYFDTVTDQLGRASTMFRLGTTEGTNTLRVTIVGNPSSTLDFNALGTVDPSAPLSLSASTVTSSASSLQANGVSTVTLTVTTRDQYGNRLPKSEGTVVFSASGGTLLGAVTPHNNGTWTQQLQAPSSNAAGSITVTATYGGIPVGNGNLIIGLISGQVDPTRSTVTISAASILADGITTALVTVTLKDALGNQVTGGGETVVMTPTAGTMVGSGVVDNLNGTYSRYLRSSTVAQLVTLRASVGGIQISGTGTIDFIPGSLNIARSTIQVSPTVIPPDGSSTSMVTVILRDANSNQLSSSTATVAIATTLGSWSGPVIYQGSASYSRVLIAPSTGGTAQITASVDGTALTQSVYVYISNGTTGPSTQKSRIRATTSTIVAADGTSTVTLQVTLRDAIGNQMTTGGSNVSLATTAGTLIGTPVDNGNGTYTQLLRAPTSSAIATVSASFDGQQIASSETVRFYGEMSPATSTLTAIPNAVTADATSTTLLVIQAKDTSGISIPVGGQTGLSLSTTGGTLLGSLADSGNGFYSQSLLAPSTSGSGTVSGTLNGVLIAQTATVTFLPSASLPSMTIDCANIATFKNTNILIDGVTVTMNSRGDAAGSPCPSDFTFNSIIIRNGGILTHSPSSSTVEYGLELTTGSLTISDSTSKIDVSGKGYVSTGAASFRVLGNATVSGKTGLASTNVGGTHGGEGGVDTAGTSLPSKVYGSITQPFTLGGSASNSGTSGGGRVKITVLSTGELANHGSILANGTDTSGALAAGAGGSVWISTPILRGFGTIAAGGGGSTGTTTSAGGGGGRVAIHYTIAQDNFSLPSNVTTNIQACGGVGGKTGTSGAAGTIFLKQSAQTYGDLIINNCNRSTSVGASGTPIDSPAPVLPDAGTTASTLNKSDGFNDNYTTSTSPYVGWSLNPSITQNGTAILGDDAWLVISSATNSSVTVASGNLLTYQSPTPAQFRVGLVLDNLEIMGRGQITGTAPIIVQSGDLRSDDTTSFAIAGAIPASLEFVSPLTVNAITLDATGTSVTSAVAAVAQLPLALTLKGGSYAYDNFATSSLVLDGATLTTGCIRTIPCINLTGQLRLTNGAYLIQKTTTTTQEYSLEIVAGSLRVESGTTITALGQGYRPATTTAKSRTLGNTEQYNRNNSTGSGNYVGGSHGGRGASNGTTGSGEQFDTYDSLVNPYYSGASGMYGGGSYISTAGGGIIRITTGSGAAVIDGSLDASGAVTTANCALTMCAGGAGGTVYLNVGALSGNGTVIANGTDYNGNYHRPGGGGRIAIYSTSRTGGFADSTLTANVRAFGGVGPSNVHGGAGTIYLKSPTQTYGDLVVNNGNKTHTYATTPINVPTTAASTALTATQLTKSAGFNDSYSTYTGHLVGFSISPKTPQNTTPTITDDTLFRIASHTANDVTIASGDMTTVGAVGNTYQVVLMVDNLELSGNGLIDTNTKILVRSGDVASGDTTTMVASGQATGTGNIEFLNSPQITLSGGTWSLPDGVTATSLALTSGATLTVGCVRTTVCINLTGALTLSGNSTLAQLATTTSTEYSIEAAVGSLNVESGSTISAVGKGYAAATTAGMSRSFDNVERANAGSTSAVTGGSHGGRGGGSSASDLYPAYDSITNPYFSGGSGGATPGSTSQPGGGIIRLTVAANAVVDGQIDASGMGNSSSNNIRAGAGGTVYLATLSLAGSGTISANGGAVNNCASVSPGGGGRIAVYYGSSAGNFTRSNATTGFRALGGRCIVNSPQGSAGTVYLKSSSQTYGDLLIDNGGVSNTVGTPISFPTNGPSTALTSTILTASGAFGGIYGLDTNAYLGYSLNPNVGQNATETTLDDTMYRIVGQNASNLMVSGGDMTSLAASGNTYRLVLVLDNFQISGNARVDSGGWILVREGDLTSNDTMTASYSGSFASNGSSLGFLDFTSTTAVTLANGSFDLFNAITADSLTLSSATATVGCVRGTTCINLTNAFTLTSSTITQRTTTSGTEYSVDVRAGTVNVDGNSTITATGKGYQALSTIGAATTLGNTVISPGCGNGVGGAHGGRGGNYCAAFGTYDSITNPAFSGASGTACQANSCSGASGTAGGGVIRLDTGTGGSMTLNGNLFANGTEATINWTTGAGGTVYLRTGSLTGTGSVAANGGNISGSYGTGGGGGRIAVYYTSATGGFAYPSGMMARLQAFGGNAAVTPSGAGSNGTIYLKSSAQTYGDLILDNNSYTTAQGNLYAPVVGPTGLTSSGLTSTTLSRTGAFLESGILTKHLVGFYLNPNTAQNGTATLTDDTVHLITDQTADTLVTGGNLTTAGSAGQTFTPVLIVDNLEIRRGGRLDAQVPILVKNGDLSSSDNTTVAINGLVQENGGRVEWQNAGNVTITLPTSSSTATGALNYLPQASSLTIHGNGGTFTLGSTSVTGSVALSGGTFNASSLTASGDVTLSSGTFNINAITSGGNIPMTAATVTAGSPDYSPTIAAAGDVTLASGTIIYSRPTTDATEMRLYVSATNLTVNSGCSINADGDGYSGRNADGIRALGNVTLAGFGYVGGSHGGRGGYQSGSGTLDPYGNFRKPVTLGSSGNGSLLYTSSAGGGAIRIAVSGTLSHAGTITANGTGNGSANGGAGAGGSIWVKASTLTGNGSFRANGGNTTKPGDGGSGGGGGRVALEYDTLGGSYTVATIGTYVTAYGGSSAASATRAGAAGTVFLKSSAQTYGDLLIHNNGLAPTSTVTTSMAPLPATPTITTVSATIMNASSGTLGNNTGNAANQWVGFHVNPNTSQNATLTLMDDTFFEISANTSSSLTVASGDMTAAPVNAVAGSTFRPVLDLDNFEVAGNATLDLTGVQVRVRNGDLSSNNTTGFVLGGTLKAHTVDIGTSGVWTAGAGSSETITRKCSSTSACP